MAAYHWVDSCTCNGVPPTALRGGTDSNGDEIYVGRAYHEADWLPAKVIPNQDIAYVSHGGEEHAKSAYQILCKKRFEWVPAGEGTVPEGAIEGGRTRDGEPLYIGRTHHNGSLTVGKIILKDLYTRMREDIDLWFSFVLQIETWFHFFSNFRMCPVDVYKVHPSHGGCYIPYGGREHHYTCYEVLVLRT